MAKGLPHFQSKDIYFDVSGMDQLLRRIDKLDATLRQKLADAINRTLIDIDREAKYKAPRGLANQLLAGIHFTIANPKNLTGRVGSYARHAAFQEFGTGPHGAGTNRQPLPPWYQHGTSHRFPPISAFVAWGKKKGLDPGWVAGRVYKNQGVPARPYFGPAVAKAQPAFLGRMKAAVREGLK